MRIRTIGTLTAILMLLSACSLLSKQEGPVVVEVTQQPILGAWGGEPHKIDVYFHAVTDPDAFLAADDRAILVTGVPVPGGRALLRRNVSPGQTREFELDLAATPEARYVGVAVRLFERGLVRRVAEVPSHGRLVLEVSDREVYRFAEASD